MDLGAQIKIYALSKKQDLNFRCAISLGSGLDLKGARGFHDDIAKADRAKIANFLFKCAGTLN